MLVARVLLLLLQVPATISQNEHGCEGERCDADSSVLLTIPRQAITVDRVKETSTATGDLPFTLAGKSIYFLVIDRFARSGKQSEDHSYCKKAADWTPNQNLGGGYCGGTLKGITSKLDYIQGMGFDCVWITPPVQSNSFMGYDATNLFEINPHFGTKQDMKELSEGLHNRGMCLVVDIVLNHMRPLVINGKLDLDSIVPFDSPEYYHQRNRGAGQSFEDYLKKGPPGAFNGQPDSQKLKKLVKRKSVSCGPTNPDQTQCDCMPGNSGLNCPSFDPSLLVEGYLGSLGDLNHSHPFVQQQMLKFVTGLVEDYAVDAFRLDTVVYVDLKFVKEVQQAAGVEILGEATVNNLTYQAQLMRDQNNERILTGLLNFPPFYELPTAFCGFRMGGEFGDWGVQGTWRAHGPDMNGLGEVMMEQLQSGQYESLDLLANFADNHDENARVNYYCKEDQLRIKSAMAWVMLAQGIPIVYYGTEQNLLGHQPKVGGIGQDEMRESMWQSHFKEDTWQYQYIKILNKIRKQNQIGAGASELKSFNEHQMIFTRACDAGKHEAWVFVNNKANSSLHELTSYCPGPLPAISGQAWYDAISGRRMDQHLIQGCFKSPDAEPKVLVLQMDQVWSV